MIAQAGGLTYSLPQRQFAQQQAQPALPEAQQQEGTPFDIPMGQDLAYVENLTNNYYTSYGRLKDFTETMWKDYGVDVTKPDFTQPGGGLMHDTFLRMDADLRMAANDLAQEKKIREEQRKAVLEGKAIYAPGYREEAQLARTLAPMQRVIPKDYLYPEVEAAQGVLNKVYNTPSESAAAFETVKPLIARFQDLKKNDPANSAIYDQQIRALNRMPTYSLPDSAFRPTKGGGGLGFIESLKKPVFDNMGFWTPERTQPKVVDGKATVAMTPEQDVNHGKVKIEIPQVGGKKTEVDTNLIVDFYYLKDGQVMARYKSPANDPKYDRRVDNKLVSEQVRQQYGEDAKLMRDFYAATADLTTPETGAVTVESFLTPQELQLGEINKQNARLQAKQLESTLNSEKNKIKEDMSAEKDIVVNINGKDYRFKNHMFGPNYYLEGEMQTAAELTGIPSPATSGIKYNQMTPDDVYKLLEKVGYFDQLIQQSAPMMTPQSQVTTKKTITQAQFEQVAKLKGAVTPEDIAKYKKQVEAKGFIIQ